VVASPGGRVDRLWTLGIGVVAFALFALTVDDVPALGDAPESVAGVDVWGVLHPPGYPSYVLLAKPFTMLVPVGTMAFRVALFSSLCAAIAVCLAFVVARRLGAGRPAAAVSAAVLATGTSFWFYAGYEKHNALSGLLVAAVVAGVLRWRDTGDRWALMAAGAAGGALAGSLWQTCAVLAPAVVIGVLWTRHRRQVATIALAAGTAVVVAVACYGFVSIRASADPPVNWGRAETASRLYDLFILDDFGFTADKVVQTTSGSDGGSFLDLFEQWWLYLRAAATETSVLAALAALGGLVASWVDPRTRPKAAVVGALAATNVLVVSYAVGIGRTFGSLLIQGSFILCLTFACAALAGVGVQAAVDAVVDRVGPDRRDERRPRVVAGAIAAVGVLLVAIAVPSHLRQLDRRSNDFATQYAGNVFATLPEDAVLFTFGAEREFPYMYAQVVEGQRPDVDVIVANALVRSWYRDQTTDRLDVELPPLAASDVSDMAGYTQRVADLLLEDRPVFVDMAAAQTFDDSLRHRPAGLVAEVLPSTEQPGAADVEALEETISSYRLDGVYDDDFMGEWPNRFVPEGYVQMHLAVARAYVERGDLDDASRHIDLALEVDPDDTTARRVAAALRDATEG
jgi:hypothetical protein